jgi:hypothetical protein
MKKIASLLLLIAFIFCGPLAHAKDSECDCDCKKGGLGIMIAGFVIGVGARTMNTVLGCDNSIGVGVGMGSELHQVRLGVGYNEGVVGLGLTFRGPKKTTVTGFVIGYDYSDCRMVWPYEE